MNRLTAHLPASTRKAPPSRLASLLAFVIRHAGAVSVDPVHMLPLDQFSQRNRPRHPARPLRRV